MTLVKLDSGDYINTDYVTRLGHRYGKLKCDPEQSETLSLSNRDDDEWISITPADKARIVEAMKDTPLHITADTVFDACCIPAWAITKGHGEML